MISSPIEEIKNKLDIVEVVGGYIKLSKAGANFRAPCPFHSEKGPSFFVSPARQIWHCFGCSKGGDVFGFVKEIEGVEFGDALRILAQKAGVELKKQSPEYDQWKSERERLYEICELACKFFEKQLEEGITGKEAKKYLLGRGITQESINKWRLGYSPDTWQGLSDFLTLRGYQKDEIQKAGLALASERGSFYDRFRGRIIFPIFDLNSQVVGFGGRVFKSEDPAKYVNSPSTLLYDKSRILYGLDKAKVEIRKKKCCILVEGYVDLIMVSQAGSENAVATSGTALTPYQLHILKRYSENLHTAFDMDLAGNSATKRGIDLAQNQGFNVRVITMPGEKDPADVILHNPQDWGKLADETKSILEFYFETTFAKIDSADPEGKREISKILLPVIKRIPSKIEQSHWVQELAKKLKVKEEIIEEEMKAAKIMDAEGSGYVIENMPGPSTVIIKNRKDILAERIASFVIKDPKNLNLIDDDCLTFMPPNIQAVLTDLRQQKSPQDANFTNYLSLKAEAEEEEGIDYGEEIKMCLMEIKKLGIKRRLNEISQDIKIAEGENDSDKISGLVQKFRETSAKLISNI
ncbi:MAG: DNA primase [Candidatus Nealsonbacteria bacterium]|nr:DNA primase [Candidatus Nealsonbacteria bacterium]